MMEMQAFQPAFLLSAIFFGKEICSCSENSEQENKIKTNCHEYHQDPA